MMLPACRRLIPLSLLGALLLVGGCQTLTEQPSAAAAPGFPAAAYHRLASAEGRVYRLDPRASAVRIYVYRAGALAAQAHNHVVTAPQFQGALFLPEQGLGQARVDIVVPLGQLEVDPAAVRRDLGGSFGSEVDEEARAGTRANMLGPDVLDVAHYPNLALHSLEVAGELPMLAIKTAISLHGVTREQWLPVAVRVEAGDLEARGALVIRQSDFGIAPFSALGGLLKVQDTIVIEFRLIGRPG